MVVETPVLIVGHDEEGFVPCGTRTDCFVDSLDVGLPCVHIMVGMLRIRAHSCGNIYTGEGIDPGKKGYDNVFREIKRLNTMTMGPKRNKKCC